MKEQDVDLIYSPPVKLTMQLSVTPEMIAVLESLAGDLGQPAHKTLRTAIALLKTVVDARKDGLSPALVDGEGQIAARLTGIGSER